MMNNSFQLLFGRTLRFIKDFPIVNKLYRWRTEILFNKRKIKDENVFTNIHTKNVWNNDESISGIGSIKAHTKELIQKLPVLCAEYKIKTLLDAPCGDFNWMQQVVFDPELTYVGGDIVKKLVENNAIKYAGQQRTFIHLNILNDRLVKADMIFVRDCLVHLSYADIRMFLQNLLKSDIPYLLTTTFPYTRNNYDVTTGNWRAINFQRAPFNFPPPLKTIHENTPENKYQYIDKSMNLYKVSDLRDLDFLRLR